VDLLSGLAGVLPDGRIVTDADELGRHGGGIFTYHAARPPDALVCPESREEVVEVLRFANDRAIPVVPFGEGSSLEAHTIPVSGGISLDLGRMDEIIEVRPDDFVARVQPGVTHERLNAKLKEHGLFFPLIRGGTPPSAGWPGRTRAGPTRCATA
jgi:D-lactate dehydrogenase (cytochrome)